MTNNKPKSTIILQELASGQKPPMTFEVPLQILMNVKKRENISECEQAQEPVKQQAGIQVQSVEMQVLPI